jgi:hypothetical protein
MTLSQYGIKTTAQEARRAGPIVDYIRLSRALEKIIWQGIYNRTNTASLPDACLACGSTYETAETHPWFYHFVSELEHLGYRVSAGGIVSW